MNGALLYQEKKLYTLNVIYVMEKRVQGVIVAVIVALYTNTHLIGESSLQKPKRALLWALDI